MSRSAERAIERLLLTPTSTRQLLLVGPARVRLPSRMLPSDLRPLQSTMYSEYVVDDLEEQKYAYPSDHQPLVDDSYDPMFFGNPHSRTSADMSHAGGSHLQVSIDPAGGIPLQLQQGDLFELTLTNASSYPAITHHGSVLPLNSAYPHTEEDSGGDTASLSSFDSRDSPASVSSGMENDDEFPLSSAECDLPQQHLHGGAASNLKKRKAPHFSSGSDSEFSDSYSSDSSRASSGHLGASSASSASPPMSSALSNCRPLQLPLPKPRDQMSPEELANHKHRQRLLRNRQSAQLSRERKKVHMQKLETEVQNLRHENDGLRARVQELTNESQQLRAQLRAAGLPEPAALAAAAAEPRSKRRRTGSAASAASAGTMLALVLSFGFLFVMTGVVPGGIHSPSVGPLGPPGRVISAPLPALPSPHAVVATSHVATAASAASAATAVASSSVGLDTKAMTEFRRQELTFVGGYPDTDSDGGETPDLLIEHTSAGQAGPGTQDSQLKITEETLKQLFDLLRSMQGAEHLFPGADSASTTSAAAAQAGRANFLFAPHAIRFSMPGAEDPAAAVKTESLKAESPTVDTEDILFADSAAGRRRHRLRAAGEPLFMDDDDDHEEATLGPRGDSRRKGDLELKIWVPSHTLKSSLVRDQADMWYPHLEQVDWSDLEQALGGDGDQPASGFGSQASFRAAQKLLVMPGGTDGHAPRAGRGRQLFHSGFTEISCTIRGLRDVLLVADK